MKAATVVAASAATASTISIHAAREGGDERGLDYIFNLFISIHAAREGGDVTSATLKGITKISIHAAREGGDAK